MAMQPEFLDAAAQDRRAVLSGLAAAPFFATTAGAATMSDNPSQQGGALGRPIIVFDVNETLLDFNVLAPVFVKIFNDPKILREWFNQVILYSEAQTLAGEYTNSGVIGVAVLEMLARIKGREVGTGDIDELKRLSGAMPTYTDTPAALAKLKQAGFRLVTLSNNPTANVEAQLTSAGLRAYFEQLHSIDDQVHRYKPARESYLSLASKLGVAPSDLWLVSCHAFDTLGAAAVGYRTALVLRPENAAIALGKAPDVVSADLDSIADHIIEKSAVGRHP